MLQGNVPAPAMPQPSGGTVTPVPPPTATPSAQTAEPTPLAHTSLLHTPQVWAAVIGLGGALLIAVLAAFLGLRADKRKWRREDAVARREAYIAFLAELTRVQMIVPGKATGADWSSAWAAHEKIKALFPSSVTDAGTELLRYLEKYLTDRDFVPDWVIWGAKKERFISAVQRGSEVPR